MGEKFEIEVHGRTTAESQKLAAELTDSLRRTQRDLPVGRVKGSDETMDLGTIVGVVVASGAAKAVAAGISTWLAKRQSAEITVSKDGKTVAKGLTSADAVRLAEIIAGRP